MWLCVMWDVCVRASVCVSVCVYVCVCVCAHACVCVYMSREALAEPPILNMPERVDWRNCKMSKEEEAEQAAAFKATFRAFDFNFT